MQEQSEACSKSSVAAWKEKKVKKESTGEKERRGEEVRNPGMEMCDRGTKRGRLITGAGQL